MAYVDVAAHEQAGHPAGEAASGPAKPTQPQATPPPQEGPGVYRPSGLWVPGRD
jgi:hypothetical protein